MQLTSEQKEALKSYGEVSVVSEYSARKIALLLGFTSIVDILEFQAYFNLPDSEIRIIYDTGKYEAEFLIDYAILQAAKDGKAVGFKELNRIKENNDLQQFIKDLDSIDEKIDE